MLFVQFVNKIIFTAGGERMSFEAIYRFLSNL